MRRSRIVAPLVAAVLGITGGATTAFLTAEGEPLPPSASDDPLRLDIEQVNLACTGDAITVLAYGESAAALGTAVADAGGDARYLRSSDSCATVYGPDPDAPPTWVVYAGPYDTPAEPCATRMEGDDRRGSVTKLTKGNTDFVKCACVLPVTSGPDLEVGMVADARDIAWTRLLQVMLNDDDPSAFPRSAVTGRYDQLTADRVATYQRRSPGKLTVEGVVDSTTWGILTDRLCDNYSW